MIMRLFSVAKVVGLIVVAGLVAGFFLLNNYIYQEKQGDDMVVQPYRASLEGTYTCLPHKESVAVPVESDCVPGIEIDTGEYYAVNFFLMSQMHPPLEDSQRFSAKGVVTPIEQAGTNEWQGYEIEGVFSVTDSLIVLGNEGGPYACTAEARLCSDGTYVGRTGPQCEFAACPSSETVSIEVTVSLGENITVRNLTISPQEVISDSRCPIDVECVRAGTVEVRTNLATQVSHGAHILALGEPQVFDEYLITLVNVLPSKTQEVIADESYAFTYLVSLK